MSSKQFDSTNEISLGEFLRTQREKKGLTVEQVASATKINVRILHALEDNQYQELPAKPFIRGFVTSYARFVQLDPQELLSRYENFIDEHAKVKPDEELGHSGYVFEKKDTDQSRTMLWVIMGSFILVGMIVMIVFKPALKHKRGHHVDKQVEKLKVSPSPVVSLNPVVVIATPSPFIEKGTDHKVSGLSPSLNPTPSPEISVEPSPGLSETQTQVVPTQISPQPSPAPEKPDPLNSGVNIPPSEVRHKIIVKALADVWVRYQSDERPVSKFVLREGRILVLRATRSVVFQSSNPKSVSIKYNQSGVTVMSQVKNLTKKTNNPTLLYGESVGSMPGSVMTGEKPLEPTPDPVIKMDTQISPSM